MIRLEPRVLNPSHVPLGTNGTMAPVCVSLAVARSSYVEPVMWYSNDDTIGEMAEELTESPLFPDGISCHELGTALSSLEMLFSREHDRVAAFWQGAPTILTVQLRESWKPSASRSGEIGREMQDVVRGSGKGSYIETDVTIHFSSGGVTSRKRRRTI